MEGVPHIGWLILILFFCASIAGVTCAVAVREWRMKNGDGEGILGEG